MLERIVDTLMADDDRLLKVMLEEELGIFLEQQSHPVVIGILTGGAAAAGGLAMALAGMAEAWWVVASAEAVLLVGVSLVRTGTPGREAVESAARWWIAAGAIGGMAYFLGELFGGR
jgi:hypothetical protein